MSAPARAPRRGLRRKPSPSLQDFALLDANEALRTLALDLISDSSRLRDVRYERGEARATLAKADAADLVMASYVIGELSEAERVSLASLLWEKTRDTLLVVEPGTPAGYARILALRRATHRSRARMSRRPARMITACPLTAPDWCHFTQRLQRSRAHKQVKGAELPFEDEKFSYVALTRAPVERRPSRVLAQPSVGKAEVAAKLCTPGRPRNHWIFPRRDKQAYAAARRWRWGDAVSLN